MKIRTLACGLAAATIALCTCGCEKSVGDSSSTYNPDLEGCTALYSGYSLVLGTKTEGLTLYKTDITDEYFVPYFFGGTGGFEFKWDKETNYLSVLETYTGMNNGVYPVYILSQSKYENLAGDSAQKSFYNPADKTFTFYVVFETSDDETGITHVFTEISFTITGDPVTE